MHIRIRPWAEPELKECEYFIDAADAQALKNRWADAFTEKVLSIRLFFGIK